MKTLLKITEENRKWWILIAMTSSISMMFLDQTILGVTLPTIQKELDTSSLALQWIVNAYLLALSALVLGMGRVCDIVGARKIYFLGTALLGTSFSGVAFSYFLVKTAPSKGRVTCTVSLLTGCSKMS